MNNQISTQILYFFLYVFFQALFLRNVALFDIAFCFIYLNFLLLLPQETDRTISILIGFVLGLFVDVFYGTLGIHSGASTLIAFIKPYVLESFIQKEKSIELSIKEIGISSFSIYMFSLILVHHSIVIFLEVADFTLFFNTVLMILASSLFTFIVALIMQFLFFSQR